MKNLFNKKILYIICGGISAYKSLETIRMFKKNGAEIKTILTNSAKEFVTPLSVTSLSQGKVYSDLFSVENETKMDHITLSRWADVILIAPATANTISKLAQGTTDDLASTVVLASNKKIYLAPAMNVRMWEHQSTKQNLKKLTGYGYHIVGPEIDGKSMSPDDFIKGMLIMDTGIPSGKNFATKIRAKLRHLRYINMFIKANQQGKLGELVAHAYFLSSKMNISQADLAGPFVKVQ